MFSLLTLLDDIATTFDDIAIMSKVALKKTSVLMSDDLAVNAGVVTGTSSERELPVVKAIFIGSLFNKVYAIGGTLILMALYPPVLKLILFLGGLYLSFEGVHKVVDKLSHKKKEKKVSITERDRINGAIRTDLVLSIEIILIAKEAITGTFMNQLMTLCLVGLAASIIIYGLVALLVKVDDLGLFLINSGHKKSGILLVNVMPYIMKALGVVGTVAMLLVGGEIITHILHLPNFSYVILQNFITALLAGFIVLIPLNYIKRVQ